MRFINLSSRLGVLSCIALAVAAPANAQLINFPFSVDLNPNIVSPRVASYSLAFQPGTNPNNNALINNDGFGNILNFYPKTGSTSAATALSSNSYFSLTLNAVSTFNLAKLNFEVGKGGSSDPRGYFVRSSVDSFSSNLISETLPLASQPAPAAKSVSLATNAFQGISTVTFRFYGFTPTANNSIDFRNLSVIAAPEPASFALLLLGGGWFVRRRKSFTK